MKKVSIIVPCRRIDEMTGKCIEECLKLDYEDFEILVLPDEEDKEIIKKFDNKKLKVISSGKVKPSFKRNSGMEKATGEFFAFIDSDAYPKKDWLENAVRYFRNEKIGMVGGPNLTPPEGNFWEKVAGYSMANFLVSGHAAIRHKISKNQLVTELPSCNYIVRKSVAPKYDSRFLTAEDTKFCFDIRKKGFKILYAGDVVVFHHRRNSLGKFLKQNFVYGRDNLWLMKSEFSKNKLHFLITLFGVLGFAAGIILSLFFPLVRNIFLILVGIYGVLFLFTSIRKNLKISFWTFFASLITPFAHGIGSLYGLFTRQKFNVFSER